MWFRGKAGRTGYAFNRMVSNAEEIWDQSIPKGYAAVKKRHKKLIGSYDGILAKAQFIDIRLSRCAYWPACPGWLIEEDGSIYPNNIDKDVWQLAYPEENVQALCIVRTFTKLIKRYITA